MSRFRDPDFLSWADDIDLDLVLGEYTDDERENVKPSSVDTVYVCPVCKREYKSISGFRGHVLKKHDKNLKAADHRKGMPMPEPIYGKSTSSESAQSKVDTVFKQAYSKSLNNLVTNEMFNIFGESSEAKIAKLCHGKSEVETFFKEIACECFESNSAASVAGREALFNRLHQKRTDKTVINKGIKTITDSCASASAFSNGSINNFIQVFILDLFGRLFSEMACAEKLTASKGSDKISDNDNTVLFYITGYIIAAVEKKYYKIKNRNTRDKKLKQMKVFHKKSSQPTFTEKFSSMVAAKDRGGLKKPCDDFFFLIREFESTIRKSINMESLSVNSLLKDSLKESVLDSFMVKHYTEKLFPPQLEEDDSVVEIQNECIEDCLNMFLTVRGHAVSKLVQRQCALQQKNEKKSRTSESLRDSLKTNKK